MTPKLTFSSTTLKDLKAVIQLDESDTFTAPWVEATAIELTPDELQQLERLKSHLFNEKLHLLNAATLWARAIYPMLLIAEQDIVRAWSEVALQAAYAQFEIEGIVDGVLGRSVAGRLEAPYLTVVETKRGVESQNPLFQLYAQLLAAARLNWELDRREPQTLFGCYTIADSWTFVRAVVSEIESDRPHLQVESSKEYSERNDAEIILRILKGIVSHFPNY